MITPKHDEVMCYLQEHIEVAARLKSHDLLYEAFGALNMAHEFGLISYAEYEELQQKTVYGE